METRLSRIFKAFQNRFFKGGNGKGNKDGQVEFSMSWSIVRNRFSYGISFLFFGFLLGNLFGTFLPFIRIIFPWDGFIVIIILFFMELISSSRYQSSRREFLGIWKSPLLRFYETRDERSAPFSLVLFPSTLSTRQENTESRQRIRLERTFSGWNSFKIGFLLGFFIDAYKVGS